MVTAGGCSTPIKQYGLTNLGVSCEEANRLTYDTLGNLGFTVSSFKLALPDCTVEILDMVAEGDRVALRFREHGHHTGTPWLGVQPLGAYVEWFPFAIYRVAGDKLAEEWFTDDPYTIKKCLGIREIKFLP